MSDTLILGENLRYSLNCFDTQLNNNVLVVGSPGSGKTRSLVIPNLLEASGSYVVADPKGLLYRQYGGYLKNNGYDVKLLDFTNPTHSLGYNFFRYFHDEQDIARAADMLVYNGKQNKQDPFWDQAGCLLLQAVIGYLVEHFGPESQNLKSVLKVLDACHTTGDLSDATSVTDRMFKEHVEAYPDSWAYRTYQRYRVAAGKTLRSILITLQAKIARFDTPQLQAMMEKDELELATIGDHKTALFVVVSDTDRSLDDLVNLFFTQAMGELVRHADKDFPEGRLPVPVRFFLDDFATNCAILDFPKMITSIRSRGISTMLMLQAESQLTHMYGDDGKTIIASCDSYVYLGGNDIETCRSISERTDVPLKKILNMPVAHNWVFRRGTDPSFQPNLRLEDYLDSIHWDANSSQMPAMNKRFLTERERAALEEAEIDPEDVLGYEDKI